MSAKRNASSAFAVILFRGFKFVTILKVDGASSANVPSHVLHNTHYKFSPHRSSTFKIDYNRYLGSSEISIMLGCYVVL
jgi:hypothetical protein